MKKIQFNINFGNRTFYTLVGIIAVLIIAGVAIAALGSTPNPGHAVSEMQACSGGETLVTNAGGVWECRGGGMVVKSQLVTDEGSYWTFSINCDAGKKVATCGTLKTNLDGGDADTFGCYLDIINQRCNFWYNQYGSNFDGGTAYCYCA